MNGIAVDPSTPWGQLNKRELAAIAERTWRLRLPFRGKDSNKDEFVTAMGGSSWRKRPGGAYKGGFDKDNGGLGNDSWTRSWRNNDYRNTRQKSKKKKQSKSSSSSSTSSSSARGRLRRAKRVLNKYSNDWTDFEEFKQRQRPRPQARRSTCARSAKDAEEDSRRSRQGMFRIREDGSRRGRGFS